jgi:hypothetical protein
MLCVAWPANTSTYALRVLRGGVQMLAAPNVSVLLSAGRLVRYNT